MTMHVFSAGIQKTVVSLAGATAFLVPIAAAAQPFADEHIRGTISSYERNDGEVRISLRDDRGFVDEVQLGADTRVSPSGTQLAPGMRVAITGYNGGKWFDAVAVEVTGRDEAAAPQQPSYARPDPMGGYASSAPAYAYPPPPPAYYAYPVPYPVPVYAYPYPAYYGPRVSFVFGFGRGWGWRH
jgi:hypothetical protein